MDLAGINFSDFKIVDLVDINFNDFENSGFSGY